VLLPHVLLPRVLLPQRLAAIGSCLPCCTCCGRHVRAGALQRATDGTDALLISAPRPVLAAEQVKRSAQVADGRRLLSVYI